jgi:autotransporter-associated beta strand protein
MKTNVWQNHIRSKALSLGLINLGMSLFLSLTAPAATYYQTLNELNSPPGGDWYGMIWSSGAPATAGNVYITEAISGTNCGLRTPNVTTNFAFAGQQLIITNLGVLALKHASATATANVILDGGQIVFRGATGSGASGLGGTLQVNFNTNTIGRSSSDSGVNFYNLGQDQTQGNSRNIALSANVSGSGNIIMNMNTAGNTSGNNVVQVTGTNTGFSGNWTNNNGVLSLEGACVNPLGSGVVTLTAAGASVRFNTTNNLVISNAIWGLGSIVQINSNTVTLAGTNLYTGATTISNGVLKIGAGVSLSNSSSISLAGGTLDASANGGLVLNVASNQPMSCNGSIIGSLTASSSGAQTNNLNFNLYLLTNDVLNISGPLTLSNNPSLTLALTGLKPNGRYRLINYSGSIQGGGSFNLIPPGSSSEGFVLDTSTAGRVDLVVSGAVVQNVKWVGDNSANIWDTTNANWTGNSTKFSQGDNVTFDDTGSVSPAIDIAMNVAPSSMLVSNDTEQYVFGQIAAGTPPGIIMGGTFTKMGTGEVDFATSGNNISGPIIIQSGTVCVGIGGATGSLGSGPITNDGILQVNLDGGAVAFNAPISGTGSLNIEDTGGISGATATIGGNGHNSYTGQTTIGALCQLNIATGDALGSAATGTIVQSGGRLGVVSYVGNMSVAEPVTISGTGVSSAPGALYVGDPDNNITWAGPITVVSSAQIRGVGNSRMNFSNVVSGADVALECSAGNPVVTGGSDASTTIFFENGVLLGSGGSMTCDGVGTVILDGATNIWGGPTTVNLGTLRVDGTLDGGAVTIGDGSDFATLTGTGTILGPVTVASASLLFPGSYSTPIGTLTISNSVTLSSGSTNLFELNRALAPNSSRLAANALSLGGTMMVVNNGNPLQAGDTFTLFSSPSISGAFGAIQLPALSSTNLYWDTSLLGSGTIRVGSYTAPSPTITSPSVTGANFVLQVTASQSGFSYVLEATPSLTAPITWTSIQTNAGTGGTLTFTNLINGSTPQQFFRIQVQ